MSRPQNAMEIYRLLDKSNCRECGKQTCLAFAGGVFTGQSRMADCPRLPPHIVRQFAENPKPDTLEQNRNAYLQTLKQEISRIDLAETARRVGARYAAGRLTLKVMGKDFGVDKTGQISTDIHVNSWVAVPFLNYILYGEGVPASGNWVSFRELKDGKERYPLFQKRCEDAVKQVADTYTDLFDDMVYLFDGRQVEKQFEADISVVLTPLPRVPVMICYWRPEDGLASSLNVFFDETADRNLSNGAIFTLGAGLAQMFGKLAQRHGHPVNGPATDRVP